jgi:hypothetical protein
VAGWIWRLYHATEDGRLFNYPVHLSRTGIRNQTTPKAAVSTTVNTPFRRVGVAV